MGLVLLLSGAPVRSASALVLAALPVGPLICGLPLARPLRARAAVAAASWVRLGRVRRHRRARWCCSCFDSLIFEHHRAWSAPRSSPRSPRRRPRACSSCCCCGYRRHELDGILDGLVYAGMVGIGFAFTENILYLAAAYIGEDGSGRRASAARDRPVHRPLHLQPVRPPALHRLHRHRHRHRRGARSQVGAHRSPRSSATSSRSLAHAAWNGSPMLGDGRNAIADLLLR